MFNLFAFIQDVAASQGQFAPYAADVIVLAAMGWVLKTTRDVAWTLKRLEQYLFGINNSGGQDKKVTKLREDVDYLLERRVGPADRRQEER